MAVSTIKLNGTTLMTVNDTTATASDVVQSKYFYAADGTKTEGNAEMPSVVLQTKSVTYTPSTSQQTDTVTAGSGYDGLSQVNVTVNAMPSGTAGTPTATKGSVSNNSILVTPSVTNITGYITGGIKTGTGVSVTASELVSGTKSISTNGTEIDVTNYASVNVAVSPSLQTKSATPTESAQTISPDSGYDGLSSVSVGAIDSEYVGSDITRRSSTDLTASGGTVNVPAGYYTSAASKAISNGSVTAPSSISGTSATVTTGTNTLTLTKTVSVTPNVTSAGYISTGTAGNSSVSLTASVTTKAASTVTPGTSNQTISANQYLTGIQTILGDSDLTAANIKTGIQIFNVTGSYTSDANATAADIINGQTAYVNGSKITGNLVVQNYYTGSSTPSSSLGSNGDLYLQT